MKYNLAELYWQQFEVLSHKCLIEAVSPNIQLIEGGSDKGREMVHTGTSKEFRKNLKGTWIFQCKHKSGDVGPARNALKTDLKKELNKVFIENKHKANNYILVTNITITGDLLDDLQKIFDDFIADNPGTCQNFGIFQYRNFELILEKTPRIIWQYPNILSHVDFEKLFNHPFEKITHTRSKGWIKSIGDRRNTFVHTAQTNAAIESLEKNNIIILTGPPKSGKTFNAEMLALYYVGNENYEAIKIDDPDEVEKFYIAEKKQIFICDDAFGSHVLSYINAEDWDRKLETIFNLADSDHKFIFSSRENIYKAFKNFAKDFDADFLPQTTITSENLSITEKGAILDRYTQLSNFADPVKQNILAQEGVFANHQNFSPESIRAFFNNFAAFDNGDTVSAQLLEHLNKPDAYLSNLFYNLNTNSQAAVLSVLCALETDYENVQRKFAQVRDDLSIKDFKSTTTEFDELDGAIIKIIKNDAKVEEVDFYHPSMQEFLIREIEKDRYGTLRKIILINLNSTLIDQFIITTKLTKPTKKSLKAIDIKVDDIKLIMTGLERILENDRIRFYNLLPFLKWLSDPDTGSTKLFEKDLFSELKKLSEYIYTKVFSEMVYSKLKEEPPVRWMNFLLIIKSLELVTGVKCLESAKTVIKNLINDKRNHAEFWRIALMSNSFLDEDEFNDVIGERWLDEFRISLATDINNLGREIYGSFFPNVQAYRANLKKSGKIEEKLKTGRNWYPNFLICQTKINLLKQTKGKAYNSEVLQAINKEWEVLMKISDTAKNRHRFIVAQGWW